MNMPDLSQALRNYQLQEDKAAMRDEMISKLADYLYQEALINDAAYQSLMDDWQPDFTSHIQRAIRNIDSANKGDKHSNDGVLSAVEHMQKELKIAARKQAELDYDD